MFLVAVNHKQLRTMASETVDPIDWSHPPPYTGQYPLSSTYCTLQCGPSCKSQHLLHWVSRERATFGVPDQRTACAATLGRQYWQTSVWLGLGYCQTGVAGPGLLPDWCGWAWVTARRWCGWAWATARQWCGWAWATARRWCGWALGLGLSYSRS